MPKRVLKGKYKRERPKWFQELEAQALALMVKAANKRDKNPYHRYFEDGSMREDAHDVWGQTRNADDFRSRMKNTRGKGGKNA